MGDTWVGEVGPASFVGNLNRLSFRSCGKLFCNACSSYESAVPEEQLYDLVRVCSWCYTSLRQQESPSSQFDRQAQIASERDQSPAQQQQRVQHLQQAPHGSQHQVLPQQKVSA